MDQKGGKNEIFICAGNDDLFCYITQASQLSTAQLSIAQLVIAQPIIIKDNFTDIKKEYINDDVLRFAVKIYCNRNCIWIVTHNNTFHMYDIIKKKWKYNFINNITYYHGVITHDNHNLDFFYNGSKIIMMIDLNFNNAIEYHINNMNNIIVLGDTIWIASSDFTSCLKFSYENNIFQITSTTLFDIVVKNIIMWKRYFFCHTSSNHIPIIYDDNICYYDQSITIDDICICPDGVLLNMVEMTMGLGNAFIIQSEKKSCLSFKIILDGCDILYINEYENEYFPLGTVSCFHDNCIKKHTIEILINTCMYATHISTGDTHYLDISQHDSSNISRIISASCNFFAIITEKKCIHYYRVRMDDIALDLEYISSDNNQIKSISDMYTNI